MASPTFAPHNGNTQPIAGDSCDVFGYLIRKGSGEGCINVYLFMYVVVLAAVLVVVFCFTIMCAVLVKCLHRRPFLNEGTGADEVVQFAQFDFADPN